SSRIAEALNTCRTISDLRQVLAGFVDDSTGLFDAVLHLPSQSRPSLPTRPAPGTSDVLLVEDLEHDTGGLSSRAVEQLRARGAQAVGYLPVHGSGEHPAVIELLWKTPRRLDEDEHVMAAALSAYASQALERAILLEDRISVAHQMQAAMLSELPRDSGLDLAACYVPAKAEERVGGDWYDALVLHEATGGRAPVLLTVGDVTGHDITAATVMGQLRAMLRQTASDHPDEQPSALLRRLERSCERFGLPATGTAVLARLTPSPDDSTWQLTWTNAGHPPPVVVGPDGTVQVLRQHDMMFGHHDLLVEPREDHALVLQAGSVLVLYTDGVTDAVAVDPEHQTDRLVELVQVHGAGGSQTLVDRLRDTFAGMDDDVVAVVVTIPQA
ncbi:MAG: serine/threonine-protein phosphatase, partial [Actinomycetales bacterium]